MGRKPRIEFKGAIYHVIQRGNNREYIFQENEDKGYFLTFLEEVKEQLPFKLLGYVVMDNHYHLMIQTEEIPLNKIMQKVNSKYSKNYNKRYNRSGHVFGGRYKGILVQDEKYLLSLLRYIHHNPVRAKLCRRMEEYRWSSDKYYRSNIRKLVEIEDILNTLSANRQKALEGYQRFMEVHEPLEKAKETYEKSHAIGEEVESVEVIKKQTIKTLDAILLETNVSEEDFFLIKAGSRKRHLKTHKVQYVKEAVICNYSLQEVADHISLSVRAVQKILENA